MSMVNIILAIGMVSRLCELVERAMRAGRDITKEEMTEAFDRATAANVNWQNAIGKKDFEEGNGQ